MRIIKLFRRAALSIGMCGLLVLSQVAGFSQPVHAADHAGYLQAINNLAAGSNDQWGFAARNCTSFVAYRMNQLGRTFHGRSFVNDWDGGQAGLGSWGDANHWDTYAKSIGFTVDHTASVGSVAQWEGGTNGHVAIVTAAHSGGTIDVEEYNWQSASNGYVNYNYGTRNDIGAADNYIHLERMLPGGMWQDNTPASGIISGTKTIAAHVEDNGGTNGNGGLDRAQITVSESSDGHTWNSWHTLQTVGYNGAKTGTISTQYALPSGKICARVSFDVFSRNRSADTLEWTRQLAPHGVRQYRASGATCDPLITENIFVDYDTQTGLGGGNSTGSGQPTTSCTPGSNQVVLFIDPNYQGNCIVKSIGDYADPNAIGLPNDTITSLKVGAGAKAMLCRDAGFSNTCEWFDYDDPDLYNNSVNTETVSSVRVTGGAPTTNCVPGPTQAAFYLNDNYDGTCIIKEIGEYPDPAAIGLPNDSISSLKVGDRVKAVVCRDNGFSNTCEWFDYNDAQLGNNSVNSDTISSARVESRGGIALCDGTNYGGECKWFGVGTYNLSGQNFNDRAESVQYTSEYAGLYHLVLHTEPNLTGYLYHADNSVPDLGSPYNNHIRSIEIYKHQPPSSTIVSPVSGTKFPSNTTNVTLGFANGEQKRVHVWNDSYNFANDWQTGDTLQLTNLTPGQYFWQVQGKNIAGEGAWSNVASFTINTAPKVPDSTLTLQPGETKVVQVVGIDADGDSVTLSASNLPSFVTFVDNHDGTATVTAAPSFANSGQYAVTIQAGDGSLSSTGILTIVVPAASGYAAEYFANQSLSGTPALTRNEQQVDFDWGGGSPDPSLPADHFSARWTKTENFAAGTYQFVTTADDGVRLYVDNELVINQWVDQPATTVSGSRTLTAGNHTIRLEYYENGGGALAQFDYYLVGGDWRGEYWNNQNGGGSPTLVRSDATLDFDWGNGSPDPALPSDHYAARWTKADNFNAGSYTFTVTADDGVRLYIDGQVVIDKWLDQPATTYTTTQNLSAGIHTIRMEYYENGGGAVARLSYQQATSSGIELLSSPWNLAGVESQERYQSMNSTILQGKTTLRITYNLRGLSALGGDASAIIIDQAGWRFISLSNYGQNGYNGEQTIDIPLSAFPGLNTASPVDGTIHTRFWYGSPYTVDITSIKVL